MYTLRKRYCTVQPLWKEWEQKAKREGLRRTIYSLNGNRYIGEWSADRKHGKGTCWYEATKELYQGDWFRGKRSGYGTLDIPHPSGKGCWRLYVGEWKHDKYEGSGICYFTNGNVYEGEWKGGHMYGWGVMTYNDKSVYEGEWQTSKRNGFGILTYANGDTYEGWWKNDLKHKNGKLTSKKKGRTFEGYWMDDFLRCGFLGEDFDEDEFDYKIRIPELHLSDVNEVLRNAKLEVKAAYGTHLHPMMTKDELKRMAEGSMIIEEYEECIEEGEGEIEGEYIPEEGHMFRETEPEHEEDQVSEESEEISEPTSASSSLTLSD